MDTASVRVSEISAQERSFDASLGEDASQRDLVNLRETYSAQRETCQREHCCCCRTMIVCTSVPQRQGPVSPGRGLSPRRERIGEALIKLVRACQGL